MGSRWATCDSRLGSVGHLSNESVAFFAFFLFTVALEAMLFFRFATLHLKTFEPLCCIVLSPLLETRAACLVTSASSHFNVLRVKIPEKCPWPASKCSQAKPRMRTGKQQKPRAAHLLEKPTSLQASKSSFCMYTEIHKYIYICVCVRQHNIIFAQLTLALYSELYSSKRTYIQPIILPTKTQFVAQQAATVSVPMFGSLSGPF